MNFAFDLDETLIDLNSAIKQLFIDNNIKHEYSVDWEFSNYPEWIRKKVFGMFSDAEIMCNLKPFSGAISLIEYLKQQRYGVMIITARNKCIHSQTVRYVNKLFKVFCHCVRPNENKVDVMKKYKIDYWIDDCPHQIEKTIQSGIFPIMISNETTPYNHYMRKHVFWKPDILELYKTLNYYNHDLLIWREKCQKIKN